MNSILLLSTLCLCKFSIILKKTCFWECNIFFHYCWGFFFYCSSWNQFWRNVTCNYVNYYWNIPETISYSPEVLNSLAPISPFSRSKDDLFLRDEIVRSKAIVFFRKFHFTPWHNTENILFPSNPWVKFGFYRDAISFLSPGNII